VCEISRSKDFPTKRYMKSTNMCSCENFLTTIHVGRFQISFCGKIFWTRNLAHILSIYKWSHDKISWPKYVFSIFGKVSKLAIVKLSLTMIHVGRLRISFFAWIFLALKFGTYVINIEMVMWRKFHGKKTIFQPSRGHQSWQ